MARIEQEFQNAMVDQGPSRYRTPGFLPRRPIPDRIDGDRFLAGEPDFDPKIGS